MEEKNIAGVVVVSMNMRVYTDFCIDSINKSPDRKKCHVVLVDNNSLPRSKEAYQTMEDKGLVDKVVFLKSNKGYAAACNEGIRHIPETYSHIAFVHNDVIVTPNWATKMKNHFLKDDIDEMAVIVPLTNYANESSSRIEKLYNKFIGKSERDEELVPIKIPNKTIKPLKNDLEKCLQLLYPEGLLEEAGKITKEMCEVVTHFYMSEISSYCMMFDRNIFNDPEIGYFDEEFWPRGWEDKYIFCKMQQKGYECWIAFDTFVHHFGNVTTDGPGFLFPDIMKTNEKLFKEKYMALEKSKEKK